MKLPALTFWQPWATLVIEGVKPYEFRDWHPHVSMIGQRIAIHAGAKAPTPLEVAELREDLERGHAGTLGPRAACAPALEVMLRHRSFGYPLGVVLGSAVLGKPVRALELFKGEVDPSTIDASKWAWPLSSPTKYPVPVPVRGGRGFWDFVT